jgi:hypothetical protein
MADSDMQEVFIPTTVAIAAAKLQSYIFRTLNTDEHVLSVDLLTFVAMKHL